MKVMNNFELGVGLKHRIYDWIYLKEKKNLKTVTEIEKCIFRPFFYFTFIAFLFSLTNGCDVFIR